MKLGKRLKQCRKRQKYTLSDVGDAISRSISFLSDIERGRVYPSFETLCKFAVLYGVSPSTLLYGVSEFGCKEDDNVALKTTVAFEVY